MGKAEDLEVRANHWQSQRIGLSYCCYGADVQLDFRGAGFFRQQFSLRDGAEIRVDRSNRAVSTDELCVVPAGADLQINFRPGFEQIVLRIETDALRGKLGALIGAAPERPIVFEEVTPAHTPEMANLRRRLDFFASELDAKDLSDSPIALAELEQLLIVSFLRANANSYSALLQEAPRRPASWQIRLVEEYIEAHWNEALTIEALSRATALSARSIFHRFRKDRGQSPMEFLKQVRLRHARRMLSQPDEATSVTEVAFECGFGNLSHFAKDYFRRFGERPSQTVARSRWARFDESRLAR